MKELVGDIATDEIIWTRFIGCEGPDVCVWKSNFSTASAWEATRKKGGMLPWNDWFWNCILLNRISMCIWKAWFNGLPVDDRV